MRQGWRALVLVLAGSVLAALSFNLLLRPCGIASGGVVGVSLLAERLLGWGPAYVQWGLNLGLLFACGARLGRGFVLKSLAGAVFVPLVVLLSQRIGPLTQNPLLATVCGGLGLGAGLGLVFRANGSVGGFSALALWWNRRFGMPMDRAILWLDGCVLGVAMVWLGPEPALYAFLCVFITGRVARAVMTGMNNAKVATIVSAKAAEIREAVLVDLPLGLTCLRGEGGYSGQPLEVLMVVMTPAELVRLKRLVHELDAHAFMIVSDAAEVLGRGFAPHG